MGSSVLLYLRHSLSASGSRETATRFGTLFLAMVALLTVALDSPAAFGADAPESAAGLAGFQIRTSNSQTLRFGVEGLQPQWKPVRAPGQESVRYELALPGFAETGGPGAPRVPGLASWVVVPPGTRAVLQTLEERWNDVEGRPLVVDPVPLVIPANGSDSGSVGELLVLPGEEIPADAPVPPSAAAAFRANRAKAAAPGLALGEERWWRGRRIVPVRLNPVRLGAAAVATAVLEAGTWEIRFVAEKSRELVLPAAQARKLVARGDERFATGFLNPGLLRSQSTEASRRPALSSQKASSGASPAKAGTLLAPEIRIPVRETRLTRVSYSVLRAEGLLPAGSFDESQIRLYQRRFLPRLAQEDPDALPYLEMEVPIHMVGQGDEFGDGDYFLFYGLQLRDDSEFHGDVGQGDEIIPGCGDPHEMNNDYNWYWLAVSDPGLGNEWARMPIAALPAASGQPLANYRRLDHFEPQTAFRQNVPTIAGDRVYANQYRDAEVSIGMNPLWAPDPAGNDASLDVVISGYNSVARSLQLDLTVEDNPLVLLEVYSLTTDRDVHRFFNLTPETIQGASATVRMRQSFLNGSLMYAYMNSAAITYDALYHTTRDRLKFNSGTSAGQRPIEVTGFTNSDLGLVEITDPRNPVYYELAAANVVPDGSTWKLSIMPEQTAGKREFYAAGDWSSNSRHDWLYYQSELVADPRDPREHEGADAPDLVVVTHADFRDPLDRWVQHRIQRAGGDLTVHIVDVQDLYDMYSGGLHDAWAIKRFAEYAITQWGTWALELVGDANENARELKINDAARGWSADWVPTHYHVQNSGIDQPEFLATDKWYATMEYGEEDYRLDNFPDRIAQPWDLYVGRLPCNNVGELNAMIDKIILVENPQTGQDWRRRCLFMADDAWSNGYGADALTTLVHSTTEETFAASERDSLARNWEFGGPVSLEVDTLFLASWMDPYGDGTTTQNRPLRDFRDYCEVDATPALLSALSRGGLIAHYQGHANAYVLATEYWFVDRIAYGRYDVDTINNVGKPWVFFGMGCHVSDWAANTVISTSAVTEQSLGEKFLIKPGSGASATIGSSGFEYINHNRVYGEYMFRRWTIHPPGGAAHLSLPGATRSRWMLGELLWATEAELLANRGSEWNYPEMVAQFQLLGDPLMILDAGEPEITATLVGEPDQEISDGQVLVATDPSNTRVVNFSARDEAGIDRIVVYDLTDGTDMSAAWATETIPAGATNQQVVDYRVEFPIRPYRHTLVAKIHDTGASLDSDRAYELTMNVEVEAEFSIEGSAVDTSQFQFTPEEPVHLQGTVRCGAWLDSGMDIGLTSETLELSNILFEVAKSNEITVYFTAVTHDDLNVSRSVILTIDGYPTPLTIEGVDPVPPISGVAKAFNFPNPMQGRTEFVFEADASNSNGRIRIFSTAGQQVVTLAITPSNYRSRNQWCVPWNGLDEQGDELGNGTYLYRIEMAAPGGWMNSDMQRLVVMR